MNTDNLEERYVLLWEAVSESVTAINKLVNTYYNEAKELHNKDLTMALKTNSQALGLIEANEVIRNALRKRNLLP